MRTHFDDDDYHESGYDYDDRYDDGYVDVDGRYGRNGDRTYDTDDTDDTDDGFYDGADRRSRTGLWVVLSLLFGIAAGVGGTLFATSFLEARAAVPSAEVASGGPIDAVSSGASWADVGQSVEAGDGFDAPEEVGSASSLPPAVESGAERLVAGDGSVTAPGDPSAPDPTADVVGCTIDNSGAPFVEVVNNTSMLSDYLLEVALLDGAGSTLAELPGEIYALRPGEHTFEELILDRSGGASCNVVNAIRQPVEVTAEAATYGSTCEIAGANTANEIEATVSVTNSDGAPSDFFVDLAIVDTAGIRRGTGSVELNNLAAGATNTAGVDTFVRFAPGLLCQVVGILRTP